MQKNINIRSILFSYKYLISLTLTTCFALLLTACQGNESSQNTSKDKPVIALLLYSASDPYIQLVSSIIKKNIGDKATLHVQTADKNQVIQSDQVQNLLDEKVDGFIINLVDPIVAADISEKIQKADLPVIFFNREPDLSILETYDNTSFVGTVAEQAGILQGDIIKTLWDTQRYDKNNDGVFQYIMIQANTANVEAVARTEYSIRQATQQHGIKLQQIGSTLMCSWDKELAREAVSQIFPLKAEKIELIIANNDTMALGAIAALQKYGYNKGGDSPYIPVIGVDAIPSATKAIQQGYMAATVKQDEQGMGKALASLILNAVQDKPLLEGTTLTWDASGRTIRIPYIRWTNKEIMQTSTQ